jgi:hypothetical protein
MTSRLDFGPNMLALFLQAHVLHAGTLAATRPFEQRDADEDRIRAEREAILDYAAKANVQGPVVLRAMRADPRLTPSIRVALWRSMGIDPDIHSRRAAA